MVVVCVCVCHGLHTHRNPTHPSHVVIALKDGECNALLLQRASRLQTCHPSTNNEHVFGGCLKR